MRGLLSNQALLGMARRKAPGSDGLPAEFYIRFWDVLGAELLEVFNFFCWFFDQESTSWGYFTNF